MIRKYGAATSCTALGVLLASAGAAFGQGQMQCYGGDPQMLIRTQPIYTGAAPQYVQSSYTARWTEYEPLAMKAKWTEMSRVPPAAQPTAAQLAAVQPASGQPQPSPQPAVPQSWQQPAAQPAMPPQIAAVPLNESPAPPTNLPATNPDATTPPGAVGCAGERIDSTTAEAARRQFEAVGFQGVRDLRKGCDNVWHAHARLNNRASYVMLNPQGDIYIEKNP